MAIGSTNTDTSKPRRRRIARMIVWGLVVLFALPVGFLGGILVLPEVVCQVEFRLVRFDRGTWQSCTGDTDIIRSPRRRMVVSAIRQHLRQGTPKEHVLQALGEPEGQWSDGKAFSYWLGYPRLFNGLDGDRLQVHFDDHDRVSNAGVTSR
jgi:hypothetical protein